MNSVRKSETVTVECESEITQILTTVSLLHA